MNWQAIRFDWNQVRAFLATAEEGSLSAAARVLGQTQPTLSRQVTALEEDLGVTLFERGPRTMLLTQTGQQLIQHVRAMGEAATQVSLIATGGAQDVSGTVSITTTPMFATFHLPPMLMRLREVAPGLMVNIVTSNTVKDLTRREADISIRHAAPTQADLIGKKVAQTEARLFASRAFLDLYGRPETQEQLHALPFIGFESLDLMAQIFQDYLPGFSIDRIVATTANGNVLLSLLREGLGISILPKDVLGYAPDLEEVWPSFPAIPVPVWLVTHRELHTSRKIRIVYDLLADEIGKLAY